jgi:uncharacterized damage-inducible protein DinB
MNLIETITAELQHEAATTRKMLERVPQEAFSWKPHEKSMSLGQLAGHVANLHQTWLTTTLTEDEYDLNHSQPLKADSVEEILQAFEQGIARAFELLAAQTDERLFTSWRLRKGDQVIFELPRWVVIRSMVINHIVHHRGQLSVYLRLRNVPLPAIYGPSADEAP